MSGDAILNTATELANTYGLTLLGAVEKPLQESELLAVLKQVAMKTTEGTHGAFTMVLTETSFMAGIVGDALTPSYQPKVSCLSGKIEGVECLARWRTKEHGLLSPDAFLPVASRKGYLPTLTSLMLGKAAADWADWKKSGLDISVAVNISSQDVRNFELVNTVKNVLEKHDMPPEKLTLELVESDFIEDMASSLEVLGRLRLAGVNLALDDFGAGFDPFVRLAKFPFTEIKVDKVFICGSENNSAAASILDLAIKLARRLKISSVCEGVETKEQWDNIRMLGATYGQGYYLARPMESGPLADLVRNWDSNKLTS